MYKTKTCIATLESMTGKMHNSEYKMPGKPMEIY